MTFLLRLLFNFFVVSPLVSSRSPPHLVFCVLYPHCPSVFPLFRVVLPSPERFTAWILRRRPFLSDYPPPIGCSFFCDFHLLLSPSCVLPFLRVAQIVCHLSARFHGASTPLSKTPPFILSVALFSFQSNSASIQVSCPSPLVLFFLLGLFPSLASRACQLPFAPCFPSVFSVLVMHHSREVQALTWLPFPLLCRFPASGDFQATRSTFGYFYWVLALGFFF